MDDPALEPAEGRMTLVEHLTELRRRIVISVIAVAVGGVIGFLLYNRILSLLAEPYAEVTKGRKGCGLNGCDLVATDPLRAVHPPAEGRDLLRHRSLRCRSCSGSCGASSPRA